MSSYTRENIIEFLKDTEESPDNIHFSFALEVLESLTKGEKATVCPLRADCEQCRDWFEQTDSMLPTDRIICPCDHYKDNIPQLAKKFKLYVSAFAECLNLPIAYKVVGKRNRFSAMQVAHLYHQNKEKVARVRRRLRKTGLLPRYVKGAIIQANPRTSGLFCFWSKTSAKRFIKVNEPYLDQAKVVKVRILKETKKPVYISTGFFCLPEMLRHFEANTSQIGEITWENTSYYNRDGLKDCVAAEWLEVLE